MFKESKFLLLIIFLSSFSIFGMEEVPPNLNNNTHLNENETELKIQAARRRLRRRQRTYKRLIKEEALQKKEKVQYTAEANEDSNSIEHNIQPSTQSTLNENSSIFKHLTFERGCWGFLGLIIFLKICFHYFINENIDDNDEAE